jgi:hypothetical protein
MPIGARSLGAEATRSLKEEFTGRKTFEQLAYRSYQ